MTFPRNPMNAEPDGSAASSKPEKKNPGKEGGGVTAEATLRAE